MASKNPRGTQGSPYNTFCPPFHPPIHPQQPPQINITVNNDDDDDDNKQALVDYEQTESIKSLYNKLEIIQDIVNDIKESSLIKLGEEEDTAYPGDKGKLNSIGIQALDSKVNWLEDIVSGFSKEIVTKDNVTNIVDEKITNSDSLNVSIESKVEQHIKETNQVEDESLSSLVDLVNDLNVKI